MKDQSNLIATSALFDLSSEDGRKYSHNAIVELFHAIQDFVRPKTFVEFGAFDATFSKRVRNMFPSSKVVAFEANPYNYQKFSSEFDFAQAQIEYKNLAVSDQDNASLSFQIQRTRSGSETSQVKGDDSLYRRNVSDPHAGHTEIKYEVVSVDAIRLDTYLNPSQFGLDDFSAWIDVEGALKQALSGASNTLSKTHSLIVEVEDRPYWTGQWLANDVEKYLKSFGFEAVARDYEFEHQYNIIYVKPEVISHYMFNHAMIQYFTNISRKRL